MTSRSEDLTVEEKVVVFFDICSSSTMLEDLLETDNMKTFRNLVISLKSSLQSLNAQSQFIAYKFVGDGWVLLFPADVSGRTLVNCLTRLSESFSQVFAKSVKPVLQHTPKVIGLTFGVEKGRLIRILMNGQEEYIGRALNVASRLQGAIKDKDKKPAYKALISKHAYKALGISSQLCKVQDVTRRLRNIRNNEKMELVKLILLVPAK